MNGWTLELRPWRFLWTVSLTFLLWYVGGGWAVLIALLLQCDVHLK